MKRAIATLTTMILASALGCQSQKKMPEPMPNAAELNAPPPVAYQPQPAPAPTAPMAAPAPAARPSARAAAPEADEGPETPIATRTYKIQKGDSLYKIAKRKYGNAGDYKKILSANPGLDPDHLQIGKTINLP